MSTQDILLLREIRKIISICNKNKNSTEGSVKPVSRISQYYKQDILELSEELTIAPLQLYHSRSTFRVEIF